MCQSNPNQNRSLSRSHSRSRPVLANRACTLAQLVNAGRGVARVATCHCQQALRRINSSNRKTIVQFVITLIVAPFASRRVWIGGYTTLTPHPAEMKADANVSTEGQSVHILNSAKCPTGKHQPPYTGKKLRAQPAVTFVYSRLDLTLLPRTNG